ncbi:MAG: hypothetical protein Q7T79_02735 [bacterium]|nr:hypothetical protein [bacterium]
METLKESIDKVELEKSQPGEAIRDDEFKTLEKFLLRGQSIKRNENNGIAIIDSEYPELTATFKSDTPFKILKEYIRESRKI